ncbi:hypothetical protein GGI04_001124 [Coemansia thaxteri]|nr:hypothetical protein GGI04_001124 [Coemansia thaxteri]
MPPEKTPVGRSGVFDDVYGADPYYRRHSVDMGVSMAAAGSGGAMPQCSPPRQRFLHPTPLQLQHSQQQQQAQSQPQLMHSQKLPSPHAFAAPQRYASRSGPGSPHPLSFDQTAGGLSPSRSGSDRGLKRALDDDDMDDDGLDDIDDDDDMDDMDDDEVDDGHVALRAGVPTAEKPYACDQCELAFSRHHNLKSHALTHSTERPFSCPICQTPFRRQHDLKRHMKLHTGEKPHTCTNCGRSFARLDALNRHMRAENFHACNQAAKKARTAAMPHHDAGGNHAEDPRLKSASAAFMEQRRASTTSSSAQLPGAPAAWSHWTHRPSIAADEAMIRRLQERFGKPSPQTASYAQAKSGAAAPPPPPAARLHSYAPSSLQMQNSRPAAAHVGPSPSYAGAPPVASAGSQQQQRPQNLPRHVHAAAGSLANPTMALSPHHHRQPQPQPQPQLPAMAYSHGYGAGSGGRAERRASPERTAAGGAATSNSPSTWNQGAASVAKAVPPGAHPLMRLPPMELAPPRRHSLAVTSHLERYRARDATPPPPPPLALAAATTPPSEAADSLRIYPPQQQQQPLAPLLEGRASISNLSAVGPPASFINYSPAMPQQPHATASSHEPAALKSEQLSTKSALPAVGGHYHALKPPSAPAPPAFRASASMGADLGISASGGGRTAASMDSKALRHAPLSSLSASSQHPLQLQSLSLHSARGPSASASASASVGAAAENSYHQHHAEAAVDSGSSRRGSAFSNGYGVGEAAPGNSRRASIIALTNPQSEIDVRLENAELKRRLDEMEAKYLKEIERLNNAVRELEIEKSLLKSLVREQRGDTMSMSPPPPASSSSLQPSPQQPLGGSSMVAVKREN